MSNLRRTAVQAMQRQADRGPEFVSSRERVTDLSDLGIASLTANQELIDTRKEVREELERTGDVTFDREKLAARNIPINKFEQIVEEERAKIPERQGPDQRVTESYKGQREDQEALMAAVGREKAGPANIKPNDPIYDPDRLLPDLRKAPKQLEFDLQGGQSGPDRFRKLPPPPTSDNTGRGESDARNQQGMGTGQAKDTGAEKSKASETDGLGDVGGDAVDTTTAKGTQPRTLTFSQQRAIQALDKEYEAKKAKAKNRKERQALAAEKLARQNEIVNLPKSTGAVPAAGFAPERPSATQKSQDVSSADKIAEQFNRKATPAQRRNAKEIPVTSNPFSEEVNARLFKKVSGAKDAVNEYLTKYPNPADGIREAYYTVINESGAAGSKRARRPDTEQYGRDEDPTSARQREELERGSSFDNAKKTVEFVENMPMSRRDRAILNEIKAAAKKDPSVDFSPDLIDDVKNGGTLYTAVNKLKTKNEPLEAAIDAGDIDKGLE
jgi:hypothetical protein